MFTAWELRESRDMALDWALNAQVKDTSSVNYGSFWRTYLWGELNDYSNDRFLECVGMTLCSLTRVAELDGDDRALEAAVLCADSYLEACHYEGPDPNLMGTMVEGHGNEFFSGSGDDGRGPRQRVLQWVIVQ